MKKLFVGLAFVALVSCSSTMTTPESNTDSAAASSDSLPAPQVSESTPTEASTDALSTPVAEPSKSSTDSSAFDNLLADGEKPKADLAKTDTASSAASSSSTSSDSLFAPGEGGEAKDATTASTSTETNPEPALPKEDPAASAPSVAAKDSSMPLPAPKDSNAYNSGGYHETKRVAPPKKLTYEEFREREIARNELESQIEDTSLFAHEAGKFQFALEYVYKPFDGFDFDSTRTGIQKATTQGAGLSFTYFPIHELSFGRFGLGAHGAAYWSKFDRNTVSSSSLSITASGRQHAIDVAGAHAVYEFDYFVGQLVVPFAYYGYDRIFVLNQKRTSSTSISNKIDSPIYGGGIHFNLNRLEPGTASKGLANVGVRKFYLTYTYLIRNIASNLTVNNVLGLRFEY